MRLAPSHASPRASAHAIERKLQSVKAASAPIATVRRRRGGADAPHRRHERGEEDERAGVPGRRRSAALVHRPPRRRPPTATGRDRQPRTACAGELAAVIDRASGRVRLLARVDAQRPRILILITLAEIGGAQTYVAQLLPALAERFDVVVAAHGPGPLRDAARDRRRALRRRSATSGARSIPCRDLLGLLELVALMRRERPDIVHVNSSKAAALGRVAAARGGRAGARCSPSTAGRSRHTTGSPRRSTAGPTG